MRGGCKANVQLTAAHTNVRCSSTCLSVVRRHPAPFGGGAGSSGRRLPAAANPTPRAHVGPRPRSQAAKILTRRIQAVATLHHWPPLLQKLTIVYTCGR